jgi:twitching motility protein PilI
VANLRGGLHGVVDLAVFLGLRARSSQDHGTEGARLVALNPSLGVNCALLVDRLAGLRHENELSGQADEAESQRPAFAGARWHDKGGRNWQEIKLAALAADVQFLAIAA